MYRRSAWTGIIFAAALVAFAAPAAAQVTPAKAVGPLVWTPSAVTQLTDNGPLRVMADFQMMHISEESSKYGFGVGVLFPFCPTASIIAQLNVNRFGYEGGGTTNTSFLAGAEYRFASESKIKPFVQGLVGVDHWGTSVFAIEPGGGFEYALNDKFNLRVTGGLHVGFWDGDTSAGFRAGFGISTPIGR